MASESRGRSASAPNGFLASNARPLSPPRVVMGTGHSSFVALPLELRRMIYQYAFSDDIVHVWVKGWKNILREDKYASPRILFRRCLRQSEEPWVFDGRWECGDMSSFCFVYNHRGSNWIPPVSRGFVEEALNACYGETLFCFGYGDQARSFFKLAHLTHPELMNRLGFLMEDIGADREAWRLFFHCLELKKSTREVNLHIAPDKDWEGFPTNIQRPDPARVHAGNYKKPFPVGPRAPSSLYALQSLPPDFQNVKVYVFPSRYDPGIPETDLQLAAEIFEAQIKAAPRRTRQSPRSVAKPQESARLSWRLALGWLPVPANVERNPNRSSLLGCSNMDDMSNTSDEY